MSIKKLTFFICTLVAVFVFQAEGHAQSQTFKTGSAIIDMGAATPTVKNSLKPYGLIYALLKYYNVPVSCVINQTKVKDGIDFTYNSKGYKGGTYIVSADYITTQVSTLLTSWAGQGVLIDYTASDLTVNVSYKLNFAPRWVMDRTNGNIAVGFLNAAGIPSSAFAFKTPAQLGDCDDIFILPHADPTWEAHRNLYFWNTNNRGAIWAGCHAVSVMENTTKDTVINGSPVTLRMNFLSTNGLVPFSDHINGALPYASFNPADPMSQYTGITDNAQVAGSETVFLPKTGSAWRSGTTMLTASPIQADIPSLSAGPAAVNIYGRGFGGASNGYVCYQGAHNIGDASAADQIAAQRIFFNFSLFALNDKVNSKISASIAGVPEQLTANTLSPVFTSAVTGDGGPFKYQWKANVAGTFSSATSATTTFTPDASIISATKCIITLIVTDASCSRISFDARLTTVLAQTPPLTSASIAKSITADCSSVDPVTFNVFDSNVNANAGTRTLLSVTGLAGGTVITTTSGSVTYTPNANFRGADAGGQYTISNGLNTSTGTIAVTVGQTSLIPVVSNDNLTAIIDNVTQINVLTNDLHKPGGTADSLYVRDISARPTKGFVYINASGTLSYLSTKDQTDITGGDSFKYLACNRNGYCSVGTVTITLVQDGCSSGQYQLTTTTSAGTATFTPTMDAHVNSGATTTNAGIATALQLNGFVNAERRPFIKFDISSISSGATVTSAITSLVTSAVFTPTSSNNPFPATVYGVTKAWTEGTGGSNDLTWSNFTTSSAWVTAGGDYTDLSPSNPTTNTSFTNNVVVPAGTIIPTQDMKNIVQGWVTTPSSNKGMVIVPAVTNSLTVGLVSREGAAANNPKLTINYSTPAACFTIPTSYKPIAYADTASTKSNTAVTINVKANDTNYYHNTNLVTAVTAPANGTASITGSNRILYTPAGNFVGTDTLTYTITDQTNNATTTATVRITVTRVAPVINADAAITNSNTAVTIAVGTNDSDPQGTLDVPVIKVTARNGTATISNTNIIYTPVAKFTGKDTLIYSRSNISGDACTAVLSDTALVVITINNQAPVAVNDSITTFACTPVDINIKANDSDPEGTQLTLVLVSNPSSGTLTTTTAGKYRYSPNTNFTGTDLFTYKVKDGSPDSLVSNTVTVKVTISGGLNPNTAPTPKPDRDSTVTNQVVNTNVLANDTDPNNDAFTISITAPGLKAPAHGTLLLLGNKMVRYIPALNFSGTDTYEYQVTDTHPGCSGNSSLSATALVTIKVKSLPVFASGTIWNDVDFSANDSFDNIKTNSEKGTNVNGSLYVYLVDSTKTIIDLTAADDDGIYTLVNVPSNTSKLSMILSTQSLAVGGTLTSTTMPAGWTNTSPGVRSFATRSADLSGYDFGVVTSTVSGGTNTTTTITICGSGTASTISPTTGALPSEGTYQWQSSVATADSGFANIAGANALTYTPAGTLTTTTYYRRKVNVTGQPAVYSNTIGVTVQLSVAGTIDGGGLSVCSVANNGALTLTGYAGSVTKWQYSINGTGFTDILNTSDVQPFASLTATTQYRAVVELSPCPVVTSAPVTVTINAIPVMGLISGPCALPRDSSGTYSVSPVANATGYTWQLPNGWTGSSTTHSILVKAGIASGVMTVTAFNGSCASASATYRVTIVDYAKITLSGTPVTAPGNKNSTILITLQLIDIDGNNITCSGGTATLCTSSGTFSTVVDHNDGSYSALLTSSANSPEICGTVAGIPIEKKIKVTFTGPQGGIKGNGPILATETPKLTFTATAGTAPFTVIYKAANSTKNDTLTNVTSGAVIGVKLIPETALYTLVSVIDANSERRDNNFIRDTATIIVLAPKIIVTLKADAPKLEKDSSWAIRLSVKVKNIGNLDLSAVQVKLNLKDVFPNPVTYALDSVRVFGTTVVPNMGYDGLQSNDLFSRINKAREKLPADITRSGLTENSMYAGNPDASPGMGSIDKALDEISKGIEVYGNTDGAETPSESNNEAHSVYMFGALSQLPVGVDGNMFLYLHIRPNGYYEPFVLQAVALGTGSTEGATALASSLSNDNENTSAHPDLTRQGDPLPTVINLIPNPVIGVSLSAGTPVDQNNGSYQVLLSYKLRNYGNVNLSGIKLFHNLSRMIGSPSVFTLVSPVTTTGTLIPNPAFDARTDTNMLTPNSELGYQQEGTLRFTISITPNQLSALYRIQATGVAVYTELGIVSTDLSTDGSNPDPDGNRLPSERVITVIAINRPVTPLVPGDIGINTNPPLRSTVLTKGYCSGASAVPVIPTSATSGGSGPYEYQWQSAADNSSFTDINGATDSIYATGTINSNLYLRRKAISDNQVGFSNSVFIQVYAASAKPVITGTGNFVIGKGNITLTSSAAKTYNWSGGQTSRSIVATDGGDYKVTITDNNDCPASATFTITSLDPAKVADLQKVLSKSPVLQSDGSFLLSFTILSSNLRTELLDSVKIKDDLTKVFPVTAEYQVVKLQASGKLLSNPLYNGLSQTELLSDGSQLPGMATDSVMVTLKVFPNGFSGTLNNIAEQTARSPYGSFRITSNDPTAGNGLTVRAPTKFIIPLIDIFIPSGFSPNRDGTNDRFVITRPFNTNINLEIFNRWGNSIYRAPDYKNEWDGKGNQPAKILGEDLPDGTYYYIVLATDKLTGIVRKFAGYVTLKR